jgi:hypothetical protein
MLMPPPQGFWRGNERRSSSRTRRPASASRRAAVAPAGPAPTTRTSSKRAPGIVNGRAILRPKFAKTQTLLYFCVVSSSLTRRVLVALAVLTPSLFGAVTADASPIRKAHVRQHRQSARRTMTTNQVFEHLAAKQAEHPVFRHPRTWLERGRHAAEPGDHQAAIQTNSSPASTEASQDAPEFRPVAFLVTAQAQFRSHDAFAHSSPRAPPACS